MKRTSTVESLVKNLARDVLISVEFAQIGEIDNLNEKFTAECRITSTWIDKTNLDMTRYDPSISWNPKIFIANLISESKETNVYTWERIHDYLRITEVKSIKGQFWERMELYDVPFDLQELNLIVQSKLKSDEINFKSSFGEYLPISKKLKQTFIDQQKWKLYSMIKISERLDYSQVNKRKWSLFKSENSNISFNDIEKNKYENKNKNVLICTCYVSRRPGYYLFNAFFLIFLITVSALTVFSIPKSAPQSRLQTTYTILLSSVSFKWVFNRSLPSVSYLTLLDMYSICGIVYITLLAAWHSLIGIYYEQWNEYIDRWMLVAFGCLFIFAHICFFFKYLSVTKQQRHLDKVQLTIEYKYHTQFENKSFY